MAQQTINIGAAPNDGTGDNPRAAFDKANENFTELYTKGAMEGLWNYNKTSTDTTTAPVSGRFKTNSGNYRDATQIAVHAITIQNIDRSSTLRTLLVGDLIQCQDSSNPAAWCRFAVQSLPVDHTTWFQVNVTLQADGNVASGDNQEIVFVFTAAATAGGGTATPVPPQGRLTLQTATPVMTTTQSAKTTIYYTPYVGNQIPLYSGTSMVPTTFTELSVATTDTTKSPAAIGASKVNDWFVWNDSGTIRLGHGPDWTSDTARSAGTALTMVGGILLNNASITNGPAAQRGTYVGTTRSNASSQLNWQLPSAANGGGAGILGVWNAYNRVMSGGHCVDTTASWTMASTTIRARNNSANNSISFVCGLVQDVAAMSNVQYATAASGAEQAIIGIGVDSTTVFSSAGGQGASGVSISCGIATNYQSLSALGYHTWYALETCNIAGSGPTFWGVITGPPLRQCNSIDFGFLM